MYNCYLMQLKYNFQQHPRASSGLSAGYTASSLLLISSNILLNKHFSRPIFKIVSI